MTIVQGYNVTVSSGGTPVDFTGDSFTKISGVTGGYQISSSSRRVFDPETRPVISIGGTPTTTAYTVDYLNGSVKFAADQAGTIRGTGKYIPMVTVAGANTISITRSRETINVSGFADRADSKFIAGMKNMTLSLDRFHTTIAQGFSDRLDKGSKVFIQYNSSSNRLIRGWFFVTSEDTSAGLSDAVSESLTFQLDPRLPFSISTI